MKRSSIHPFISRTYPTPHSIIGCPWLHVNLFLPRLSQIKKNQKWLGWPPQNFVSMLGSPRVRSWAQNYPPLPPPISLDYLQCSTVHVALCMWFSWSWYLTRGQNKFLTPPTPPSVLFLSSVNIECYIKVISSIIFKLHDLFMQKFGVYTVSWKCGLPRFSKWTVGSLTFTTEGKCAVV